MTSLNQLAQPYLLATAKFSIDHVTPVWSQGCNRPLSESHCEQLRKTFKLGLHREDPQHHLRLACSKADFDQVQAHLQRRGRLPSPHEPYMDLMSWAEVIERPVELMAGAHRVEALKRYLKDQGRDTDPDERWWICTLYDKDRLPFELTLQLRANREDVLLQDSNGHIWHEMVTLSRHDPTLFHGNLHTVEEQMKRCLRLNSRNNFPVRRLGTLWRNDQWRPMITRLCGFSLGQFLFSISTFEWMSSCRIDDFWFRPLQQVIDAAQLLQTECQLHLTLTDWQQLSRHSTLRDTLIPDVDRIFYTQSHEEGEDADADADADADQDDIRPIRSRAKGLFTKLTDDEYTQIYKTISQHPDLRFPDIQAFLKISKTEGKLISSVLTHVGQWLHSHPFVVLDRAGTKPPLRQDFLPALRATHGDAADAVSIDLQHQIAIFVKDHAKALTSHGVAHWLTESPVTHAATYRDRFHHASWSQLLNLVYDVCGPHFHGEVMQYVNHEPPATSSDQNRSSLSGVIYHALAGSPAILRNPVLRQQSALDDLAQQLEPVIQQWVVRQCRAGFREEWRWPADVQAILREDLQLYTISTPTDYTGQQPTPASTQTSTQHDMEAAHPPGTSDTVRPTTPPPVTAAASTNPPSTAGASADAFNPASSSHPASLATPRFAAPTANFQSPAGTDTRRSAAASSLTPRTNMKVGLSRPSHRKNNVQPSSASPKLWPSPQPGSVSISVDGEAAKRRKITTPGGSGWRKSLGVQSRPSQSR